MALSLGDEAGGLTRTHTLPGAECVFVDDQTINLPPATALGITTVHAQPRHQLHSTAHSDARPAATTRNPDRPVSESGLEAEVYGQGGGAFVEGADGGVVGEDHEGCAGRRQSEWWVQPLSMAFPATAAVACWCVRLLVTAGAGSPGDYRYRVWKRELAELAAETELTITV